MNTPSIGYEDDTTLTKSEAATLQLDEAITLFVSGRFLPAITLAGAAEEILGKLLARRSELPAVKDSTRAIEQLRAKTGLALVGSKTEKEIIDTWNAPRNLLKHLVGPEDEPITLNLCDEAYWMIRRALANAEKLNLPVENVQDFENWFIVNVAH